MVPIKTIVSVITLGVLIVAQKRGNIPSPGEVDAAIVNINLHYNDRLCLELLLVDCATHVTQGDEKVCGTDGKTYENHCKFTHAMCVFLHSNGHHLSLSHRGECTTNTIPPTKVDTGSTISPKTSVTGSTVPSATLALGSNSSITPAISVQGSTMPPTTTTTVGMTTTMVKVTATTDPIANIVQNVFCQNVASISCGSSFEILCGSDGQFYPNQCEMSKQKCKDPSLTVAADKSTCPITGR